MSIWRLSYIVKPLILIGYFFRRFAPKGCRITDEMSQQINPHFRFTALCSCVAYIVHIKCVYMCVIFPQNQSIQIGSGRRLTSIIRCARSITGISSRPNEYCIRKPIQLNLTQSTYTSAWLYGEQAKKQWTHCASSSVHGRRAQNSI